MHFPLLLHVPLVWEAYWCNSTYFNLCYVYMIPLDYSKGFGGKYGVQKDRVDKVRVWIWCFHKSITIQLIQSWKDSGQDMKRDIKDLLLQSCSVAARVLLNMQWNPQMHSFPFSDLSFCCCAKFPIKLFLSLSLQAAVDWNYEGKTEAHASQKGLLHSIGHCHRDKTFILFSWVFMTSRGLIKE